METIGNKVVFKKIDSGKEKKTESGLVVFMDTYGTFIRAEVVAVGKEVTGIVKGDIVLVKDGVGINFDKDGEEYFQCIEDDIDAKEE